MVFVASDPSAKDGLFPGGCSGNPRETLIGTAGVKCPFQGWR